MPEYIENKIRESVKKAHPDYDEERVNQEVYATMNSRGLLRRSAKGRRKRHAH